GLGMRMRALVFGMFALVLSGCGTLSASLEPSLYPDDPHAAVATPLVSADGADRVEPVRPPGASEDRSEIEAAVASGTAPPPEVSAPAFGTVAFEPEPAGQPSEVTAPAAPAQSPPAPGAAQKSGHL